MGTLDLAVVVIYMLASVGIGLAMARRATEGSGAEHYFLGARNMPAGAVMLSVVATETSALTVISVPGLAARGDWTFLQLAFGYLLGRVAVAVWLLPGYFSGSQQTAYERLQARFGIATRQALSATFLVTRFLADGVRIFAGAIPLALLTGWDLPWAIVVMGAVTLLYTFFGGLKAVVWTDTLQLLVYVAGGLAALLIAVQMAGGWGETFSMAQAAGKLRVLDFSWSFSGPIVFMGGLLGGAMLSAASHGTDHIIVQRLLATRSLRDARIALVGSGLLVIVQFGLFLAVGTALWAAGQAPAERAGDELFPRFVIDHLPAGLAGLVVAGVLAAAMSTISSSISALASSTTNDLYAPLAGRVGDDRHLLRVGRWMSLLWGVGLTLGALGFHALASGRDAPVVVLALSVASVTYGALLGAYLLAGVRRVAGRHVITAAAITVLLMLGVVFAAPLAALPGLGWLSPLAGLSFVWYVPLGTAITVAVGWAGSTLSGRRSPPA